jgi:guanylate kinase
MEKSQKLIIITAPSGAGKTSITRHLMSVFPQLAFSVSATTRSPRNYESHGHDYYFLSEEEFKRHIQQEDFLEWEMVYEGKYYGTLKLELARIWQQNKVPILDIDVKGAIHVQQQLSGRCLSLFIEAPSLQALKERLVSRGTETPESLETRLNKASYELSFQGNFDVVIVNDDFNKACAEAQVAVRAFLTL